MLGESTIVEHLTAKYVRSKFRNSGDYINQIVTPPKSFCSIRDVYMQEELKMYANSLMPLCSATV